MSSLVNKTIVRFICFAFHFNCASTSDHCTLSFLSYCALNYYYTATLIAAQSWSTLATDGFSLFNFNMSLLYIIFISAFTIAGVVD